MRHVRDEGLRRTANLRPQTFHRTRLHHCPADNRCGSPPSHLMSFRGPLRSVGLIVLSTREPVRIDAFRVDPRHCPQLQRPQQHDFTPMTQRIVIRSLKLDDELLRTIDHRKRNQLLGCMHAHNELTFLNRLLLFPQNSVTEGNLHGEGLGLLEKGLGCTCLKRSREWVPVVAGSPQGASRSREYLRRRSGARGASRLDEWRPGDGGWAKRLSSPSGAAPGACKDAQTTGYTVTTNQGTKRMVNIYDVEAKELVIDDMTGDCQGWREALVDQRFSSRLVG